MPNILHLEPYEPLGDLVKIVLEEHKVDTAETEEQAIQKLKENKYDLVLTEIELIGHTESGYDFAKMVKEQYKTRVAFLTNCAAYEQMEKGKAITPYYMVKPFENKKLVEMVNVALCASSNKSC